MAEEMVPWVKKCLQGKQKGLSLDPHYPLKADRPLRPQCQDWGRDRKSTRPHWPVGGVEVVDFIFKGRPQKPEVQSNRGGH